MNQENAAERDHQVSLMGEIYRGAEAVFAFLGPMIDAGFYDSDSDSVVEESMSGRLPLRIGRRRFARRRYESTDLYRRLDSLLDTSASLENFYQPDMISAYLEVFGRGYWSRLWIVQELGLAKDVLFYLGDAAISREHLYRRLTQMALYPDRPTAEDNLDEIRRSADEKKVKELYARRGNAFRSLLRSSGREGTLFSVLQRYSQNACSDPRDKVYGLLSLVEPEQRVTVDYHESKEVVALQALRIMITNMSDCRVRLNFSWSFTAPDPMQLATNRLQGIVENILGSEESLLQTMQAMCWAYWLHQLPNDLILRRRWHTHVSESTTKARNAGQESAPGSLQWERFANRLLKGRSELWDCILDSAVTKHQKAFAERLQGFGEDELSTHFSTTRTIDQGAQSVRVRDPRRITRLALKIRNGIDRLAVEFGFVEYDGFLSHPSDWPFP